MDDHSPSEGWQDEVDRSIDITRDRDFPPELLDSTLETDSTLLDASHLLLDMDHLSLRKGYSFTDLDFSTSYAIYQKIGYRTVTDFRMVSFKG